MSLLEHGVYTLLLDRYYATEHGIPADQAHRVARAKTRDEKSAVDAVLSEFFELTDGVWRQGRVERSISEYREGDGDREARKENAKERQRRARDRRKVIFDVLRGHAVVPPWDTTTGDLERLLSRMESQPVTPPVTRDSTATHTPDTNLQEKEQKQKQPQAAMPDVPDWIHPEAWQGFADSRKKLRFPMTPRAASLVIRELDKLRATGADPNAVLDQSTRNGWRDVFPLKSQGQAHATREPRVGLADRHPQSAERTDAITGTAIRLDA